MELNELRVQNYRSIENSDWVPISDLTCLVGKNESGKTGFMQAVEKLNPRYRSPDYDEYRDYPRSRWVDYNQRKQIEGDVDDVASARFILYESDVRRIEHQYKENLLTEETAVLTKNYNNIKRWELPLDESVYVQWVLDQFEIPDSTEDMLRESRDVEALRENLDASTSENPVIQNIREEIETGIHDIQQQIGQQVLTEDVPEFHYMGDYSIMNSTISVDDLQRKQQNDTLSDADTVFMSLLSVVDLDLSEISSEPDWERIITTLEAASGYVTDYMMKYWTQNENITITFNREQANPDGPSQFDQGDLLQVRVRNAEYDDVTTIGFNQRSRGFRWFFSSFCHFANMRRTEEDLVLLLDEPGLHLHARAQQDFLDFLDKELSSAHTVIYSTHSPFMIDPRNLPNTKLVMRERESGTTVSSDVLRTDDDTRFPLQTVFEFDLIDTLLIRPQTLLVEGKSDQIYLYTMSEIVEEHGGEGLDSQWTVLNTGSGDNVPTFVSLFGSNDLDLAVLLDGDSQFESRVTRIEETGEIAPEHVKPVTAFIDGEYGDIEELFSREFYLMLVSGAYQRDLLIDDNLPNEITEVELESENQNPRIVTHLERYFEENDIDEGIFRHAAPAKHFQDHLDDLREQVDETSIENFEKLFSGFNDVLDDFETGEE